MLRITTLAFLGLGLLACNGGDPECDEDEELNDDGECEEIEDTSDTNDTVDTGPTDTGPSNTLQVSWVGTATIVLDEGGNTYAGSETSKYTSIDGPNAGKLLCSIVSDATGAAHTKASDCTDCDFTFEVTLSNEAVSGDSCAAIGIEADPSATQAFGYGFATATKDTDGTDLANVLMYFSSQDSEWAPIGHATTTYADGEFAYDWPGSYFYY